jgi:hypothetical protein
LYEPGLTDPKSALFRSGGLSTGGDLPNSPPLFAWFKLCKRVYLVAEVTLLMGLERFEPVGLDFFELLEEPSDSVKTRPLSRLPTRECASTFE